MRLPADEGAIELAPRGDGRVRGDRGRCGQVRAGVPVLPGVGVPIGRHYRVPEEDAGQHPTLRRAQPDLVRRTHLRQRSARWEGAPEVYSVRAEDAGPGTALDMGVAPVG